jgi:hypothetical protein
LRLTCVRCGRIERLEGVLENERWRRGGRLAPAPMRAGRLLAQQVDNDRKGLDLSTWLVHDSADGPPIGIIHWESGPRGRRYFAARLDSWPDGQAVKASTAEGCLRKLARTDQTRSAGRRS